ncbi:amino acid ABC transporter substrate-binding protein [bacterium]|nr:amino acid ABC transporter substrate-binding protein [bacterium]
MTTLLTLGLGVSQDSQASQGTPPEFRVTAILPVSGALDARGQDLRLGLELAGDHLSTQYGLRVKLNVLDNKSSNVEAGLLAKSIDSMKEKPHIVIGGVNELSARAIKLHLEKAQVPMIFPVLQESSLLRGSRFVHSLSATPTTWIKKAWELSAKDLRAKKVVIFMPLAQGGIDAFLGEAQKHKPKGVELKVFSYGESQPDKEKILNDAYEFRPDVMWVPWADERLELMIKGMKARAWTRPFIGFELWDFKSWKEKLGDSWKGHYLLRQYSPEFDSDLAKDFRKLLKNSKIEGEVRDDLALSFEALVLAGKAFHKSAYRAEGLTFVKVLRRLGKFEGLSGSYPIRPDGQIDHPVLKVETTASGFRLLN